MIMSNTRISSTQGYIEMANELLRQLRIPKQIQRLEEIGANIFVPLYEGLCGEELPEIRGPATSREDQLVNLQAVIDSLSTDVLHVSLSHIRAEDILDGDRTAICNLLEIFQGLMEYLLHRLDSEGSTVGEAEDLQEEENGEHVNDANRRNISNGSENHPDDLPPVERRKPAVGRSDRDVDGRHRPPADDRSVDSPVAVGGASGKLTAGDLEADLARTRLDRVEREASEAGHLTSAVAEAARLRQRRDAQRAVALRRRIREYLATRRHDLDLLAGDLRPRAADTAEQEWLEDYLRLARRRGPGEALAEGEDDVSPFGSPRGVPGEGEEEARAAERLRSLLEEHEDRVAGVKARRVPRAGPAGGPRRPVSAGPGPVAAVAEERRRGAERADRFGQARRDILRDSYDRALEEAGAGADDTVHQRRRRAAEKENAVRRVAAVKDGDRGVRPLPRGTGGLVKPRIKLCAANARPLPHELVGVGEPAPLADPDRDILAYLVDRFPYMQLSHHTLNELWHRANRHKERIATSAQQEDRRGRPLGREEAAMNEAERRQYVLSQILRKELGYNRRLRDRREREAAQRELKARERERRMQAVRAKKYYDEFTLQNRAKMLRARDKEETLFRKLFKEALHAQRERIHDMRKYSRDVRDRRLAREMDEIKSLENFYRDRFQILADSLKKERKDIVTQDDEQTKLLRQLKKELRDRLEHEVREIQSAVQADQEDDYFRERDAERILCDIFRGGAVDLR